MSTKIYRIIERALIFVTDKKFKDTDKLYGVMERIFIEFRDNGDTIESVKCGLRLLDSDVSIERCENFLDKFYDGVCQDEDLYKRISLILQQKGIKISQEEFQKLNEKIERNHTELSKKMDSMAVNLSGSNSNYKESITTKDLKFQNDKKQKYIKNWNSRLFLHLDNDERPITLADAFIMPDYRIYKAIKRIGFLKDDTLDKIIDKFVKYDRTSTMLITGVPGIGKSSITSWIANEYKDDDRVIILRFRDWSKEDLEQGVINIICSSFDCKRDDLKNKILIIDGFDEIKSVNKHKNLIQELIDNTLDYDNLKVIITSRPGYLDVNYFQNLFEILPLNFFQIKQFYQIIKGIELAQDRIDCGNLDILGIPVILYMAIMADSDLTLKTTKPELYSCIFAENGGIFDKFCFKGIGYDNGFHPLRDKENAKKYLNFLQKVAFSMFERNDLTLTKDEYQIPKLKFQEQKLRIVEFPIKPFFETDGYNIEFIHKSIYEYFVSEYFIEKITGTINSPKYKKNLAESLGTLFHESVLTYEIIEFMKYKVRESGLQKEYEKIRGTVQLMLEDGMLYYSNQHHKNIINQEVNVFANVLHLIHLWRNDFFLFDEKICPYLEIKSNLKFNLRKARLRNLDLAGANLRKADLTEADLSKVILERADLTEADLSKAILVEADLTGADLVGTNLKGADLTRANMIRADLGNIMLEDATLTDAIFDEGQILNLRYAYNLSGTAIYVRSTGAVLSYEEYCNNYSNLTKNNPN